MAIQAGTTAIRSGLHALLLGDESIRVVGQSAAVEDLKGILPEVDVFIRFPDEAGVLRGTWIEPEEIPPGCAVLVIGEEETVTSQVPEGPRVWGYLPREFSGEELITAVRTLALGLTVFPPSFVHDRMVRQTAKTANFGQTQHNPLTSREVEILQRLALGMANKQIAENLKISPNTVKYHIASIYEKIGATNRAEAVTRGMQQGLLSI
ncbi:MAG: response regulator transcription factor [Anaerolineaceae bacterium]|nr:response regulator transcription factor [Anaerolineaceae bacterium]